MGKQNKEFLGVIPRDRIKNVVINRPSKEIVQQFLQLEDMSGATARALDVLGINGSIASVSLKPIVEGNKIVGPAITVRDVPSKISRYYGIVNQLPSYQKGESEAYFIAEPGDVIVIDSGGQTIASSMGSSSAKLALSKGMAGSIIDGVCTGIPGIIKSGYPVWCRGGTTITGHHRLETVEINGIISCSGVQVKPGDLIIADDSGVAVVPYEQIEAVLNIIQNMAKRGSSRDSDEKKPSIIGKEISKFGRDDISLIRS